MPALQPVFAALEAILRPYASALEVVTDTSSELYLDTRHIQKNRKPLFFGAVQLKKNHVSLHLMPVYLQPGLVEGITPGLRKRMQGKSCFNFQAVDDELFGELAALTRAGHASYRQQGFV